MKKFNDWLGDKLALWLSTMACFYVISIAILATLFFQRPEGLQAWLLFWVTVFFQGVALPVLGYVSRKSGEKQELLLQETHDAVMAELKEYKNLLSSQQFELSMLRMMHRDLNKLIKGNPNGNNGKQ